MSDIVNEYFKRFYPANWRDAEREFTTMLGGMERVRDCKVSNVFPAMEFADGVTLSVQGHYGAYSQPRDDFAERYWQVECGYPSEPIEELKPYQDGDGDPCQSVYGYVPVEVVAAIIAKHGGLKPTTPEPR